MRLALAVTPIDDERMKIARQIGVTDVVTVLPGMEPEDVWELMPLVQLRKRVEDAGLRLSVIEGIPITDRIKIGLPGRDEDLEIFCQSVRNMGAAGIPILCYNWIAVLGVIRTSFTTRSRGNALVSSYDHGQLEDAPLTEYGTVSEEQLWDSLEVFLKRVLPVAEEAGVKLAMHPDDPPVISPIRGIARMMGTVKAFDRLVEMVPSEANGITFCQGNFSPMGADVPAAIRHFGPKIFFAHFRDVKGVVPVFEEAFHDDGQTDMAECVRAYRDIGFDGPIRPDHYPVLEGEPQDRPNQGVMGRLFAIGYMKGLIDGIA